MLSAAQALFCQHGYAGTSTRRIAEVAGVTEGLIFHYFANKDALLLELAARRHTFAGHVLTLVERGGYSARELLHAVADGLVGVSPEEGAFIGFMLAESQINPTLQARLTAATAVVLDGFVAALAERVPAGEVHPDADLWATSHGFFGGFLFFFSQHRHLGATAWRRRARGFATAWAEQCWRGIARTPKLSKYSKIAKKSQRPGHARTQA